jgi:ABC-type Mn2+/Zn2+ transport system permease subunit
VAAGGIGLALSWLLDAPSGACVATTLAGYGTLSVLKRENLA